MITSRSKGTIQILQIPIIEMVETCFEDLLKYFQNIFSVNILYTYTRFFNNIYQYI